MKQWYKIEDGKVIGINMTGSVVNSGADCEILDVSRPDPLIMKMTREEAEEFAEKNGLEMFR